MAERAIDPSRRPVPFEQWPDGDRALWDRAIRPGDVLDDPGTAAHWTSATRKSYRFAYGRWLAFLERQGWLDNAVRAHERADPEQIAAYMLLLQDQVSSITLWSYVSDLHNVLYRLCPNHDWTWLRRIVNRLCQQAVPSRVITPRLRPIGSLYQAGIRLMDQAEKVRPYRPLHDSVHFRDGLMIAFLAATLVRLRNFSGIRIGRHLIRLPEGYLLFIPAEEVKNKLPIETLLPDELTPYIYRYLDHHRPRLLPNRLSDLLWISAEGQVMAAHNVGMRITRVTKRLLGVAISPHLFRHCAATSIATDSPRMARMTRALLVHTSNATGEKHYNRANMLDAGRRHAAVLADLRTSLRSEMEAPHSCAP